MVRAKCEYTRTINVLQGELPKKVRLLRLEKYYDTSSNYIEWRLIFYMAPNSIVMEAIVGVEGTEIIGGEVFSEIPFRELLTKVRVFC